MVMDLPDQVARAQPKAKPSAQELLEQMRQKQAHKEVLKNLNDKGKPSAAAVKASEKSASELGEMKLVVPGSSNKEMESSIHEEPYNQKLLSTEEFFEEELGMGDQMVQPGFSVGKETSLRQTEHVPTANTASHGKATDLNFVVHENESPEKASGKMGTIKEEEMEQSAKKEYQDSDGDSDTAYFNNEVNEREEEEIRSYTRKQMDELYQQEDEDNQPYEQSDEEGPDD